jgi:hypothetical protein
MFSNGCRKSSELTYCHFPPIVLWRMTLKPARPLKAAGCSFPAAPSTAWQKLVAVGALSRVHAAKEFYGRGQDLGPSASPMARKPSSASGASRPVELEKNWRNPPLRTSDWHQWAA